ncbi:bifunctional adenosylcobinamide kinase/adenosylcobinamide-phosphate guanylyltransferase [Limnochorda pilosa]|uniref:Adenosylcobinamide kinase n=1 Tax=Limnochorda pilosa TaxID=1555112 RepID=A0A0K2SQQ3_LIMPI|nr:bifunctional adenosylcobinamide kinase/adenosylcobinamide-phosphate guanylyltransferase [Limnochorda pilosa]BAS29327.1 cobinamide kinase [Limnochorda pilosa]
MPELILVTGGARSGKSRWAERLAGARGGPVTFVATARVEDAEMAERVRRHRARRPPEWRTVEAPLGLARVLRDLAAEDSRSAGAGDVARASRKAAPVIVDCLTLLLSNLLLEASRGREGGEEGPPDPGVEEAVLGEVRAALEAAEALVGPVIFVTNEVGGGIVPLSPVARRFRDLAGLANQEAAARAGRVYWMISGIPVRVKGSPFPGEENLR